MTTLTRIVLRLGRNPDAGRPDGDDHHGYVLHAPLDADHRLDPVAFATCREACTVRRFREGEAPSDGWLRHRGGDWWFWYDEADEGPEEHGVKLGEHRFFPGEYVTIHEHGGPPLTFRVAEAVRA